LTSQGQSSSWQVRLDEQQQAGRQAGNKALIAGRQAVPALHTEEVRGPLQLQGAHPNSTTCMACWHAGCADYSWQKSLVFDVKSTTAAAAGLQSLGWSKQLAGE
jgi:hypothetical protein